MAPKWNVEKASPLASFQDGPWTKDSQWETKKDANLRAAEIEHNGFFVVRVVAR